MRCTRRSAASSIPPERLLRALLLQAFYSIRSERQLVERIDYDLLFRWFVGLGIEDPVWDATTFTKNRDRLLDGRGGAASYSPPCWRTTRSRALLSNEHFSVDGTLLEAWASPKSFRPKDGSGTPPGAGPQRRARLPRREAARTTPTPRRPTPMRGCSARGRARRPGCASWAMR